VFLVKGGAPARLAITHAPGMGLSDSASRTVPATTDNDIKV